MQMFKKVKLELPTARVFVRTWEEKGQLKGEQLPSRRELLKEYKHLQADEVYANNKYQVNIHYDAESTGAIVPNPDIKVVHVSVKRKDKKPNIPYKDLMAIKNELVGKEYEALMLYPAHSREVDTANQYHLWIPVDQEGKALPIPFGWDRGRHVWN